MKKNTLLLIILCSIDVAAQVTEKYHRVKRIDTNGSSVHDFCLNGTTSTLDHKLNILIKDRFPVGTTFYYNFGGELCFGLSHIHVILVPVIKTIL